jgi:hypothetical protein
MNILSFAIGFLLLVILSVMIVAEFFPSVSSHKMMPLLHNILTSPAFPRIPFQAYMLSNDALRPTFNTISHD